MQLFNWAFTSIRDRSAGHPSGFLVRQVHRLLTMPYLNMTACGTRRLRAESGVRPLNPQENTLPEALPKRCFMTSSSDRSDESTAPPWRDELLAAREGAQRERLDTSEETRAVYDGAVPGSHQLIFGGPKKH